MATKVLINIKTSTIRGHNGSVTVDFELDISNCVGALQHEQSINFQSNLSPNASATSLNNSIAAFVRGYAETNWAAEFGILDNVKIVGAVDGLLV